MAPVPSAETEEWREERLLHLLQVTRDCVDVQVVRWALRLRPEEDVFAFLVARKRICGCSTKTGLVKPLPEATPLPSSPREEHPELEILDKLISTLLDVFVENGNVHVSYWRLEARVDWEEREDWACLREHFTLPRLLACFSLFDHNFVKQSCALSFRNYAVWGAERFVKMKLQGWQQDVEVQPLAGVDLEEASSRTGSKETSGGDENASPHDPVGPPGGEFLSLVSVARQLRWANAFAPHVGDFLEWAWRTPGLEIGVRLTKADFASKDCQLENRERSEKAALRALAARLDQQPSGSEHIASLRQGLAWRDYGLGPLEKFAKKYTAWFEMHGEMVTLLEGRRMANDNSQQQTPAQVPLDKADVAGPLAAAAPATQGNQTRLPEDADREDDHDEHEDHECSGGSDSEDGEDRLEVEVQPASTFRRRPPVPFRLQGEEVLAYHEMCVKQALSAPSPSEGKSSSSSACPPCSGDLLAKLGEEAERFAREVCLTPSDWAQREAVWRSIEAALKTGTTPLTAQWPSLRVAALGTSASGLGRRDSDLDLLLDLDGAGNRELSREVIAKVLIEAEAALRAAGAESLEVVSGARIPLVRGSLQGVKFDLSVGTLCGLWNTRLLRSLATARPDIVIPLCVVIGAWSKLRGVNDSPNGLLSTYSLLLMVTFFLQTQGLMPSGDLSEFASGDVLSGMPPALSDCSSLQHEELGRLLVGFFFFMCSFRWDAFVVSVRCAAALPRTSKSKIWRVQPLCVEDPFETHLNTCRRVNPRGQRLILATAESALRSLLAGAGLKALLGPSNASGAAKRSEKKAA